MTPPLGGRPRGRNRLGPPGVNCAPDRDDSPFLCTLAPQRGGRILDSFAVILNVAFTQARGDSPAGPPQTAMFY